MKIIDKLAWIEIKDKSILSTKSFGKDKYYIPGGKMEAPIKVTISGRGKVTTCFAREDLFVHVRQWLII